MEEQKNNPGEQEPRDENDAPLPEEWRKLSEAAWRIWPLGTVPSWLDEGHHGHPYTRSCR